MRINCHLLGATSPSVDWPEFKSQGRPLSVIFARNIDYLMTIIGLKNYCGLCIDYYEILKTQ